MQPVDLAGFMTALRPWLLVLLAALAYGLAQLSWYGNTPLGEVPVLDERENLALAGQIADGSLPREPFYRAMGYPLLLAGIQAAGVSAEQLPMAALLLGVALHAASAVLAGALARRWFSDDRAGLFAGLLVAFNPVLLHYATQRLDATFGLVLFLGGLACLRLERPSPGAGAAAGASVCWALAALTRPQFLVVWLILPLVWLWRQRNRAGATGVLAALAAGGVLFVAQGMWQKKVAGEFRILPWQGAYNLWSANQPGAHGRYYFQTIDLSHPGQDDNPARLESVALYRRDSGGGADTIDAMNAYWRGRFLSGVTHHPVAWLGLLARKTYALFNDWEQYNNKTYAFHKALSPWLRWNPIGWGLLLVLGTAGAWRLRARSPLAFPLALAIAATYAAGVVLFYVSARFRLPLAALLAVLAGGALADPGFWRELAPGPRRLLAGSMLGAALLAFSAFDGVRDARPFVQDHLLAARAAQAVGDDDQVWQHARAALGLDPGRREADEFVVTSGFNRQLAGELPPAELAAWKESARRLLMDGGAAGPAARVIAATVGQDAATLRTLGAGDRLTALDALGGLALIHAATPAELARLRAAPWNAGSTLFLLARQTLDPAGFSAWARTHQARGWDEAMAVVRRRLFPSA
ncbi:MAG TPA: hypothetical protein VG838_10355 [Opitutaceae bacterium]|nr:hypothetical protein [Opitutaceae bacterium]